jgi:clan AA aspartic protease (TIGR02281 family)
MIDTGATHTTLSREVLAALGGTVPDNAKRLTLETADQRRITGQLFILPQLQVGPCILKNVQVVVCEHCTCLLGQSTLGRFDLTTNRAGGLEILSMKLRS